MSGDTGDACPYGREWCEGPTVPGHCDPCELDRQGHSGRAPAPPPDMSGDTGETRYDRADVEWAAGVVALACARSGLSVEAATAISVDVTVAVAARLAAERERGAAEAGERIAREIEKVRSTHWQKHLRDHPLADARSCPVDYAKHDAYARAARIARAVLPPESEGPKGFRWPTTVQVGNDTRPTAETTWTPEPPESEGS